MARRRCERNFCFNCWPFSVYNYNFILHHILYHENDVFEISYCRKIIVFVTANGNATWQMCTINNFDCKIFNLKAAKREQQCLFMMLTSAKLCILWTEHSPIYIPKKLNNIKSEKKLIVLCNV